MFLSHRTIEAPRLGAWLRTHAAVHSRFRVHLVQNARVVSEDRLLMRAVDRLGAVGRPVLTVVLRGRARIRAFGREIWLERGDATLVEHKQAIAMRQEGDRFESLAIEWDVGSLGTRAPRLMQATRLDPTTLRTVEAHAAVLADRALPLPVAAAALAHVLSALHASGIPFDRVPADDLIEPVARETVQLSSTLDLLLSNLASQPMVIDLDTTLGLSARQLQRVVTGFHERYGFNAGSWRDARNRRRLMLGATLMTVPGATTEAIGQVVGYRSPAAFCKALAEVGLVSPGRVRDEVAALA